MITFFFLSILSVGFLLFLGIKQEINFRKNSIEQKDTDIVKTSLLAEFWKQSFNFKGKTKRRDFWMTQVFIFLLYLLLVCIGICLFLDIQNDCCLNKSTPLQTYILFPIYGFSIVTLIPSISLQVRRLRDAAKNPWWILISFVPFIGGIVLLIFYLSPSRKKRLPMTLQDRLSEVEDLLKKGTIDEEEYKYMRKKILTKYVD